MYFTGEKLEARIRSLNELRFKNSKRMKILGYKKAEGDAVGAYPPDADDLSGWRPLDNGTVLTGRDEYYWFRMEAEISPEMKNPVGLFDFGSGSGGNTEGFESLLFLHGRPYMGVDSNHQVVRLPLPEATRNAPLILDFQFWSGLGGYQIHAVPEHRFSRAELAELDLPAEDLYYYCRAILDTVNVLDQNDPWKAALLSLLDRTLPRLDWSRPGTEDFYAQVPEILANLKEELDGMPSHHPVTVNCIGHTHIDVAWLWRLRHTRVKSARSFSTALKLMEEYPEFRFLQTQPQLYDYLSRDYPQIMEGIREKVKAGQWEPGGAMWLEADCNIPSGESLIRQLLMGKEYFRKEFGKECTYLWLPDVFGYSWALPQILAKSGIKMMMTTKISWNQYNRMPHDTFYWRGMDGSEILTHFITTPDPSGNEGAFYYTYNGTISPETVTGIWQAYRNKDLNKELILAYGHGDGGGGVTRDMIETGKRMRKIPGTPQVRFSRADEYFRDLEDRMAQERAEGKNGHFAVWDGELYLELHRGTYTSQAKSKAWNRKLEILYRNIEFLAAFKEMQTGQKQETSLLQEGWKILLRNQFHDIIPGSSIREVYEDSWKEYKAALDLGNEFRCKLFGQSSEEETTDTAGKRVYTLWNTEAERSSLLFLPGESGEARNSRNELLESQEGTGPEDCSVPDAPAVQGLWVHLPDLPGYSTSRISVENLETKTQRPSPFTCREQGVTTPFYELEWNDKGRICRLFDKEHHREILKEGEEANCFQIFEDTPKSRHEAWDIDLFYQDKMDTAEDLVEFSQKSSGPLFAEYQFAWTYRNSRVDQILRVYAHSRRIDFVTQVDWQESRRLLKAAFPVEIRSTEATYDIQFGTIRRPTHWNTSWDQARFEVPAHQWADLSETGYGVSLLNDCKYGYDIKDHVMRLTLIKAAKVPDAYADLGRHSFSYALLPHKGSWQEGETLIQARDLNNPLTAFRTEAPFPGEDETALFTLSEDLILVDAVKKAEDGKGYIIRLHEHKGQRGKISLTFSYPVKIWRECMMTEEVLSGGVSGRGAQMDFLITPYEVKTFRIEPA